MDYFLLFFLFLPGSSCPGRSAKHVFALDVPGIHVFLSFDKM